MTLDKYVNVSAVYDDGGNCVVPRRVPKKKKTVRFSRFSRPNASGTISYDDALLAQHATIDTYHNRGRGPVPSVRLLVAVVRPQRSGRNRRWTHTRVC